MVIFAWLLQRRITNVTTSVQKGLLTTCDKRLSRTKELLGILIPTKFFSWEDHWVELISKARDTEVKWLNRSMYPRLYELFCVAEGMNTSVSQQDTGFAGLGICARPGVIVLLPCLYLSREPTDALYCLYRKYETLMIY